MRNEIPTTYGRVLRRTDRDVRLAVNMRYASYDCNLPAIATTHPDGVEALTLFFPEGKEAAAHRATRLGWVDVTESWRAEEAPSPEPVEEVRDAAPSAVAETSTSKATPTEGALAKMTWTALRALAKERGVSTRGSRDSVEAAVLASFEG
jgi:hypothetical protein